MCDGVRALIQWKAKVCRGCQGLKDTKSGAESHAGATFVTSTCIKGTLATLFLENSKGTLGPKDKNLGVSPHSKDYSISSRWKKTLNFHRWKPPALLQCSPSAELQSKGAFQWDQLKFQSSLQPKGRSCACPSPEPCQASPLASPCPGGAHAESCFSFSIPSPSRCGFWLQQWLNEFMWKFRGQRTSEDCISKLCCISLD